MSDYTNQLAKENANLETEIQKKENELRINDRTNDYYLQDEVMMVYIHKMLTILYVVIYFFFIWIDNDCIFSFHYIYNFFFFSFIFLIYFN